MEVEVRFIYNKTRNTPIERGFDIMYIEGYSYEEIENDSKKDREVTDLLTTLIQQKYGYYSVKITSFSEL